jgi:hypothetical protein
MLRAFDKMRIAGLGKFGAGIIGDVSHHIAVAAQNQHVGDIRLQLLAAGQRKQMRLALGAGNVDQIRLVEARRLSQHRTGDGDVIVLGQPPHELDRRIRDWSEPVGELRLGAAFDFLDQAAEDIVEQADMVFVEAVRTGEKQRGNLPQHFAMLFGAAMEQRRFQFRNERGKGRHHAGNTQTRVNTGLFRI